MKLSVANWKHDVGRSALQAIAKPLPRTSPACRGNLELGAGCVTVPSLYPYYLLAIVYVFVGPVQRGLDKADMAGKGQSQTKRLIQELRSYDEEPSNALLHLGPVSDDDLSHWRAVMKGVEGTAYEGKPHPPEAPTLRVPTHAPTRRTLGPRRHHPTKLPERPPDHPLRDPNLPSKRALQDGRDMSGSAEDELEPGVHDQGDDAGDPAALDERGAG